MTTKQERGVAKMIVHLENGRIKVTHGYDKVTLFDEPVAEGTWETIWLAIQSGVISEQVKVTA